MSKIRVYELAKELNVSSKDLINLLMEEFGVEVKNHMSVIEDEDATLIKELLGDNSDNEGKKSLVEEYEDELAESLNKGVRKKKKTKKELDYNPEYTYIKMLKDFKKEMKDEPFAQLWGTGKYYDDLYKDKI